MVKKCLKCGANKEMTPENFSVKRASADGFDSWCKKCKKASDANRYKKSREKILRQKQEYYQKNKKARKEYQLAYYFENKESCTEAEKEWRESNPIKRRVLNNNHRALSFDAEGALTEEQWISVKEYFGNCCAYCGISEKDSKKEFKEVLHIEHLLPLEHGGTNSMDNVVPSCRRCNSSKRNNDFSAWYPAYLFYSQARELKIANRPRQAEGLNHG